MEDPRKFAFFTGPYGEALKLKAFAESVNAQKEEREQRRQLFQMQLEQHQKANQILDFNTMMALRSMHALPAEAGASTQGDAAMRAGAGITDENYRPLTQTPVGQYRLPSESDADKRAEADALRAGKQKGITEKAAKDVYDPDEQFDLGPRYGNRKVMVPRSRIPQLIDKLNPDWTMKESTNNTGDVTRVWYDDRGNEQKRVVETGAGKTARPVAGAGKTGLSSGAYHAMANAQKAIDEAAPRLGKQGDDRSQEERWTAARAAVEQAAAAYPDELEGALGTGGYPYIKPKGKAQATAANAGAAKPYAGKSIAQVNVQRAAAIKKMKPEAFIRQWQAGGGTITP